MHLVIKFIFFFWLPVVLAGDTIWDFIPEQPPNTSPNVNLLVRQQYYCPSGTTSWTSYTTIFYETILGVTYTYTYTIQVGDGTTRTAGLGTPTATPTPTTPLPGVTTPTVTPPKFPTPSLPTSSSNSTSTTSSRAPAFTAQLSAGTTDHFPTSSSVLVTILCALGLILG
ncbi:hypothetical protein OPQ81_000249 [Rhizoctonia solani]|nr:hypothetical protein OPQ81_000249 [Rhizoctonia solani]